jgi:uncharacterized protein
MIEAATIYAGTVVHKRLRPKPHALSYGVFSLLLDLDQLATIDKASRLFSVNRFNVLSFYDKDYGPGDGQPAADHARALLSKAGFNASALKILLLSYPRVLGYVFNPLSVYFAIDQSERLVALIYEVNNTWGERRSYVVAAGNDHLGTFAQSAKKELLVSPFAEARGRYGFRVTKPDNTHDLLVGVLLSDSQGALLKTHFKASPESWSDRRLAGLLVRYPLLTFKIITAIHVEAFKLWWKGVPVTGGATTPGYSVSFGDVPQHHQNPTQQTQ